MAVRRGPKFSELSDASSFGLADKAVTSHGTLASGMQLQVAVWTGPATLTEGTDILFSSRAAQYAVGQNILIGGGGQSATSDVSDTFKGSYLTSLGFDALAGVTSGFRMTAIGRKALYSSTEAYDVVGVGYEAGRENTSGYSCVFIGNYAGLNNTTGRSNTICGDNAAASNTTGYALAVFGASALNKLDHATNNYGHTAIGFQALGNLVEGVEMTACGNQALVGSTVADRCSAFGEKCLDGNTIGNRNSGLGHRAGYLQKEGSDNVFAGAFAADGNVGLWSASGCCIVGAYSFFNIGAGPNTSLGAFSGYTNETGTGNVFLGFKAGYYETGSNKLFIDNAPRASEADARVKALIYGVFGAAVTDQTLFVNANLAIPDACKIGFGSDIANFWIGGTVSDVSGITFHSYYGWTLQGRSGAGLNVLGTGQVGIGKAATATSPLCLAGLPTSSAGLVTGDVWLNSNVLTIVP